MWIVASVQRARMGMGDATVYEDREAALAAFLSMYDGCRKRPNMAPMDFRLDREGSGYFETRGASVYLVPAAIGGLS